ncbi:MAG: DMT family transporter, partial [Nitrospirota bacterium]
MISGSFKTITSTGLALIAFAANSVLCRLALGTHAIDASSFTVIRLVSGAVVLLIILIIKRRKYNTQSKGRWSAGTALFLYAVTFSFAYNTLDTGTGALVLFSAVQITMIAMSIVAKKRLHISEWTGVFIAFAGFVYLVLPDAAAPSVTGLLLMTAAGTAWGIYTLKGQGSVSPLMDTAYNFMRTVPFVIVLAVVSLQNKHYSFDGVLLAVLSGGIASGIGYTIWYTALSGLSAVQAAVVQLMVPVIAAFGGVIFMSETITLRLAISSVIVLGGILLVILGRHYFVE